VHVYVCCVCLCSTMGWLRSVGSIKLYVSYAEYLFYRALLQKRPTILSILLTKATPYDHFSLDATEACVGDKTRHICEASFHAGEQQKKSNKKICTYSTTADVEMALRVKILRDSWKNCVGLTVVVGVRIERSCCMWCCGIWHFADLYLLAACVLHT